MSKQPSNLPTLLERLREDVMRTLHTDVIVSVDCSEAADEIERLTKELTIQKAVNDLAYIPHRSLAEDNDRYRKARDRYRAALTDLATNDKLYNERAMRTAAAALSAEPGAPSQRDCRHMWTVRSMRDPQPDHVCAHGCGFTWKQRCAQELRGGPETPGDVDDPVDVDTQTLGPLGG